MSPPTGYIEFSTPGIMNFVRRLPTIQTSYMRSVFSNNAQVYYKEHSLQSSGAGTVSNSRAKSRRT